MGSDEKNGKNTYVAFEGLEKSKEDVKKISESAMEDLQKLPYENTFLIELIKELIERKK